MRNIFKRISTILYGNSALLILVVFTIFIIPFFPISLQRRLFSISYTAIFFMTTFALEEGRRIILIMAFAAVIAEWITEITELKYLHFISGTVRIIFFSVVIVKIIIQITRTKKIDSSTILEAVNGYLLLGIMFALLVLYMTYILPDSFGTDMGPKAGGAKYIYFTFVTMSTLGYGDITPATPPAQSLATLISVTGQIYIAVILALLVGKYAALSNIGKK